MSNMTVDEMAVAIKRIPVLEERVNELFALLERITLKKTSMTLAEAASYLGYKTTSFYQIYKKHNIPFTRIGRGKVRFLVRDLDEFAFKNITEDTHFQLTK